MSIYDKASLVQIPSGYKGGGTKNLYSVVPNTADGDFDYSGGTNGTRVNKDGLIETIAADTPRLNYPLLNGVVQSNPTLLLEPQRINIYTYSEDLSQGTTLTNTSVNETSIVSPDGALTGNKLTQTSGAYLRKNLSVVLSGTYAWSFFAKKGDLRYLNARSLFVLNGTTPANGNTIIDLDTNTIAYKGTNVTSATIEQYPNDWIKVEIVATDNATGSGDFVDFFFTDSDTSTQSTGVAGNGYIWGVQFESGSYPTSYIPTTVAVTRTVEQCEVTSGLENIIGQTEGTVFIDFEYLYETTSSSSTDALMDIFVVGTASDLSEGISIDNYRSQFRVFVQGSGMTTQSIGNNTTGAAQPNTRYKLAVKYKTGDCKAYLNGSLLGSSTGTVSFATDLDGIFFSYNDSSRSFKNQKRVYQLMVFNEALTDAELQTLTS